MFVILQLPIKNSSSAAALNIRKTSMKIFRTTQIASRIVF
jgi:hypothetical protein